MRDPRRLLALVLVALLATACVPLEPTAEPTSTRLLADTPRPTTTQFPTPSEQAPESTFTSVGNVAFLEGAHGVSGKAIVAGLQTLILTQFTFDGKGPKADIRLVQGQDYDHPAAVLLELEQRPYDGQALIMIIPSSAGPGTADRIVVYVPETGEVYAESTFQ